MRPRCPCPCGGWLQRARLSARVPGNGRPGHALRRTRGLVQGKAWRQYSGAVGSGRVRLQHGKGTACCCRVMTRNLMEGESRSWKSACGRHPAPHALQGEGELWAAGEQSKDPRAAHLAQDERHAPESCSLRFARILASSRCTRWGVGSRSSYSTGDLAFDLCT